MGDILAITKALADENRLRVLCVLHGRELCGCQIIALLGLAPSTVSKHMSVLRQARLVAGRKDGRWMHYRPAGREAPAEARQAASWVRRSLAGTPVFRRDAKRMKEILKADPEELCRRQTRR